MAAEDEKPKTEDVLERSSKLPEEILGAHEARADFLKWKLVLVAALGAAGFSLEGNAEVAHAHLFLALIPFVCIYVDLLCTNLKVRIIVIGTFYAEFRRDIYERYTARNRKVFQLEDWALYYSTYGLCILLALVGFFSQTFKNNMSFEWPVKEDIILYVAGLAGFGLSLLLNHRSQWLLEHLTAQTDTHEVQNIKMGGLMSPEYTAAEFKALCGFLVQKGVFIFKSLPNGLFSAAASAGAKDVSGYQHVWVRDNIHVAHAHYVCGDTKTAGRTLATLMRYFQKYRKRFRDIIADKDKALAADPMNRPNIRFDGRKLAEVGQKWAHAQNDALGYFLWCYCKLAREGAVKLEDMDVESLAEFPLYFEAIEYWQDKDSGHWEEQRKVSASSIGTVVAGLREFARLMDEKQLWSHSIMTGHKLDSNRVKHLKEQGMAALDKILPCESIEPEECYRRYDSALLFLIYPLEVVTGDMAKVILEDVKTHLQGDYGIRRYLGDSYWFPDYKKIPAGKRTDDFSDSMEERDTGTQLGQEAQWCIFDPIMSVIYGKMHLVKKGEHATEQAKEFLRLQTVYFNRSLSQLTSKSKGVPEFRSPEAYYLEDGDYVPNDQTPLLWSQANLWLAMNQMRQSVEDAG